MMQHCGPISGIAAWQDRYVATAGYDNQIILWDQRNKMPLTRSWHDHLANQCAFSPDGRYLITSSSDYSARLWSVPDLRLRAVFAAHDDDVEMSTFHPSKELIATASRDHRVRVYDFSGQLLVTFEGHRADVISVEWAKEADEVISSSDDGTIKRWSLERRDLIEDIDMAGVETDTVALSSDGAIFAGNDDGEVLVLRDGERMVLPAHDAGIKRVVFDNGRNLLVSLSYDRTMRLWSYVDGALKLRDLADLPVDVWPRSCAFAGESQLIFATFGATYRWYDYELKRWEDSEIPITPGKNAVHPYQGGTLAVGDAGMVWRDDAVQAQLGSLCNFLTPVNDVVFTGGQLGKVFDAVSGRELHQHRSPLNCGVSFERDGLSQVIVGTYTGEGLLFTVDGDQVKYLRDVRLHANAVKGVAVSGDLLFSVCADTSATWYRISTMEHVATLADAHDRIANGCAGLGDGFFASVSRDLKLRVWDPQQRASILDTPHTNSIKCVVASTDGRFIATGAYNGRIAVYDRHAEDWSAVVRPTTAGISSLAYDNEAKLFLASSYDSHIYRVSPCGTR